MHERWERVALGHLTTQVKDAVLIEPGLTYTNLGVRWYSRGLFDKTTKVGSAIKAKQLFRVRPGQFVYNRLFATEGSFAVATPANADGLVSNEFPVFDVDSSLLLPEYLGLHFQQPSVWSDVAKECVGTTSSRSRWKEDRFAAHTMALPPLAEQRRIVDLIGTVDEAIEAAEAAAARTHEAHVAALRRAVSQSAGLNSSLEGMFGYILGGAWGSPSGVAEQEVIALGPSAYAGEATNVRPERGSPRSLSRKRAHARSLEQGDVVLERSGGSPTQRVGRVIRMTSDTAWVVPSDFMRLLRPDRNVVEPEFAFWVLWSSYRAGESEEFQSYTTGIRNLNIPAYLREVKVSIPDRATQAAIAEVGEAFEIFSVETRQFGDLLPALRSELLASLLSGGHEIPASYDRLLGASTTSANGVGPTNAEVAA